MKSWKASRYSHKRQWRLYEEQESGNHIVTRGEARLYEKLESE